ncbi:DUF2339 domain-containing protein [Breoghania sp. L-A4]|nr:DUF2339 domain-containing protein [Breoghania sp. L-A4]
MPGVRSEAASEPPAPPSPPAAPKRAFEERFGASWTVWIGGIALVFGGIFLVRYSIESGLLTPLARVLCGAALALALIGAGEWTRRGAGGIAANTAGRAYIPGVLTLAGITTAFASVFAAHALYDLIGPATAFVLLGSVALLTLAASVLHGPAVASFGLIACYVVPFLVTSDEPAVLPLAFYGLFVTLATYGVARIRRWRWLAIAGAGGAVFWAHVLAFASGPADAGNLALYDLAVLGIAAFIFVVSLHPRDASDARATPDWLAAGVLAAHALPVLYLLQIDSFGTLSVATLVIACAALLVIASEWPAAAGAALGQRRSARSPISPGTCRCLPTSWPTTSPETRACSTPCRTRRRTASCASARASRRCLPPPAFSVPCVRPAAGRWPPPAPPRRLSSSPSPICARTYSSWKRCSVPWRWPWRRASPR